MTVRILVGDCRDVLAGLPAGSVHTCVTSPPYWGLRSYLPAGHPDKARELGSERTPEEYVAHLVEVFGAVRRVLREDGTCWINIGDSFFGSGGSGGDYLDGGLREGQPRVKSVFKRHATLKPKDLTLIPERLAIALQEDGWWIRSRIAWCLSGGTRVYARTQKGDMPTTVKDLVRLDPKTVQLWNGERWTQAVDWWKSEAPGDPLEITLRTGERIGCTPEHLWPTARGVMQAKDLRVGDVLTATRLPQPEAYKTPHALDDELTGWLVGFYVAEGSRTSQGPRFTVSADETAYYDRIKSVAEQFHGSATWRVATGKAAVIGVSGRIVEAIIDTYVAGNGAGGKHLANACWQRSDEFLQAVLQGYLDGDGHYEADTGRWRLGFKRNYAWESDLRTLCARLGASLRIGPAFASFNGQKFPIHRGHIRMLASARAKQDAEIMAIGKSKGRTFWDIEVADDPHIFALASGILTHNCKRACMPESVTDRPTSAWEHIWLLTKSARYYYDAEAVKEASMPESEARYRYAFSGPPEGRKDPNGHERLVIEGTREYQPTRQQRNYWLLSPEPSRATKTYRRVRVTADEADDDTERITSPDCLIHGHRQGASVSHDEPQAAVLPRMSHNDNDLVPTQGIEPAPTLLPSSGPPWQQCLAGLFATEHSTPSSKTAPRLATSQPCTASVETLARTDDMSVQRDGESRRHGRNESSTSGDSVADGKGQRHEEQTACRIADTESTPAAAPPPASDCDRGIASRTTESKTGHALGDPSVDTGIGTIHTSSCTCSYYKVIIAESAHYAQFPTEIPRRCILAGSPERCCPTCGKGWVRVVARTPLSEIMRGGQNGEKGRGRQAMGLNAGKSGLSCSNSHNGSTPTAPIRETVDWRPGCSCEQNDGSGRAVVLDCFAGAGTTLLVADRLGRDGIGIELNPQYADMARQRITAEAPLFAVVQP